MGNPTGFLQFEREDALLRNPDLRIKDFDEFHLSITDEVLRTQAARCMDCGIAFCHAGELVQGQSIGCPLNNLIPETNDLVYRGFIEAAYERMRMTHPFPEFTSRVCPALCEGSCTLGENEQPVTVKEIERSVDEYMTNNNLIKARVPSVRTEKKVAVVGSGPSGLSAAYFLNQYGNQVTVFERADRPGGLMMYGIPNMKLDKQIVLDRVALMQQEGIDFQYGIEVGIDIKLETLQQDFDAIVLCGGATKARLMTVPGADLAGVVPAVKYLTNATKHLLDNNKDFKAAFDDDSLNAKGKNVIVVGGGDTGTDCVGTAIRQGAKTVTQLEIMPEAPSVRAAGNPWPTWPKLVKTDYGQYEAIDLFGSDPREYETNTLQLIDNGQGQIGSIETVKVDWQVINGRMTPVEVEGTKQIRDCDLLLVAMGFLGPEQTMIDDLQLATDNRSNISTPPDSYAASAPSIFTAGDMHRGQSLVVWAIMEGREAAKECHEYLKNSEK
jgi:glutamate synthase (NADPH/NADH) small chain